MTGPPNLHLVQWHRYFQLAWFLKSILRRDELLHRLWRPPDQENERSSLVSLAGALINPPHTILQALG